MAFDDGYEVTSVRGVERVLVFDDAVGKILCWRIGTTEVSASRLGVLCRSGAFRGWAWSPKIGNTASTVCHVIALAREQQKTLEAGAGHICHSAAWELAFLDASKRPILPTTDGGMPDSKIGTIMNRAFAAREAAGF